MMFHGVLWGHLRVYQRDSCIKIWYPCWSECSQTNGKLVSCGIYPRRTLNLQHVLWFQIYHAGLYGPRYQWLYWSGRHGLLSQMEPGILGIVWEDDCTPDQIRLALEGTITFDPITTGNTEPYNIVGISGYVSNCYDSNTYRTKFEKGGNLLNALTAGKYVIQVNWYNINGPFALIL